MHKSDAVAEHDETDISPVRHAHSGSGGIDRKRESALARRPEALSFLISLVDHAATQRNDFTSER